MPDEHGGVVKENYQWKVGTLHNNFFYGIICTQTCTCMCRTVSLHYSDIMSSIKSILLVVTY